MLTLVGCANTPAPSAGADPGGAARRVLVLDHGLHAGLYIARHDLLEELPALADTLGDGDWVELGWGDEAFYRDPQAGLGLALQALLGPTPAVLHVRGIGADPRRTPAPALVTVHLGASAYRRLLAFVGASFSRTAQGGLADLGPGLHPDSRFYRAEGRYSLLRTCNTWLAEALSASGCPLRPATVVTSGQLLSRLRTMPAAGKACRPGR
ncbi:DUF2459 domain-containing protein [Pseudomonas lalucatii]|uniref:DUF2459 domain-containing protein n=1 Tax=Pseudomonas lalucatii TaxID=1424203 RepID=A0ABS5Q4N8_9PSED|nr:DUF2459 domain-containing protein [Pseudomonas lalucatii]MBS7663726.1 DUF2459 domain-containing protein [Pseudomonas lalucatii]